MPFPVVSGLPPSTKEQEKGVEEILIRIVARVMDITYDVVHPRFHYLSHEPRDPTKVFIDVKIETSMYTKPWVPRWWTRWRNRKEIHALKRNVATKVSELFGHRYPVECFIVHLDKGVHI